MTTLLDITQGILSDMSGDAVNSIFDTEEAEQVARIVVSTYNAIVSRNEWKYHRRLVTLVPSTDSNLPTHMTLPTNVKELISVNYNKIKTGETRQSFREVKFCLPDDFLRRTNLRDDTSTNITTVADPSGIMLYIKNDKAPEWYTSFDDTTIVFDSWDSAVDSTLVEAKTQAQAYIQPTLSLLDTSVPDLPLDAVAYLIEESTSRCQLKIAEFQDLKAEQEAGSQKRAISRKAWRVNSERRYPDYGRKT